MNIDDLRFLVIEDHPFQRAAIVSLLETLGAAKVGQAADGVAAFEYIAGDPAVDIVISDLEMPGMDGMEFIRHLAEGDLPIAIILTSVHDRALLASVRTMTEAYGIRVLGAIEKPVTAEKLLASIDQYARTPAHTPTAATPLSFSEADISAALSARVFEPLFQPKVDFASGVVKGAEALARWYHPDCGLVSPYAFVPALEINQRIDELTWIMLEKSAVACRDWRAQGLELNVSVNLSLASLTNVGFADRITELVRAQDLDPRYMTLEVTETIAMTHLGRALENLARLRIKGFGLSIDDYGTGYSSLQHLSRIPFTELKVDQAFVISAAEKPACRVILESSIDIARKLGLSVVAEGVESGADWDLLKSLGCDVAQGYFVARPMGAANIPEWLAAWKAPA